MLSVKVEQKKLPLTNVYIHSQASMLTFPIATMIPPSSPRPASMKLRDDTNRSVFAFAPPPLDSVQAAQSPRHVFPDQDDSFDTSDTFDSCDSESEVIIDVSLSCDTEESAHAEVLSSTPLGDVRLGTPILPPRVRVVPPTPGTEASSTTVSKDETLLALPGQWTPSKREQFMQAIFSAARYNLNTEQLAKEVSALLLWADCKAPDAVG